MGVFKSNTNTATNPGWSLPVISAKKNFMSGNFRSSDELHVLTSPGLTTRTKTMGQTAISVDREHLSMNIYQPLVLVWPGDR